MKAIRRRYALVMWMVLMTILSFCSAARPGGADGVKLDAHGSVVQDDGSTVEEYELRESNPTLAHFVSLGSAAHKLLHKSGYAYGSLVGIKHSDRDKEFGEGPDRKEWFPMVVLLSVVEDAPDAEGDDVTVQYEVALDYDPVNIAAPGLVILDARKFDVDGRLAASLEVLPPVQKGFIEKNQQGITMMFGVIIASGVVKFLRRGVERLVNKMKQDRDEAEAAASAASAPGKAQSSGGNPKKSNKTDAKQD